MKKIRIFSTSFLVPFLTLGILRLAWCFDKKNPEVIDDCLISADCTDNTTIDDLQNTYLTAYGTEPFWDIEISWWIATFSSPMYETEVVEPITIRQEWGNYFFSWEELEWEFILKDCIDGWKWDMHYYTVWVAKIRDYYYEWCGDWIEWIKMSDEDVPEGYYQYEEVFDEEAICVESLWQYSQEEMAWDSQTVISVDCFPKNHYWPQYITGYVYATTYEDLWLKISTPAWRDLLDDNGIFNNKSETPIFTRSWNKISYIHPRFWNEREFVQVYEKSSDESLENIIKNKHLWNWCSISRDFYVDEISFISSSYPWIKIYSIEDENLGVYIWKDCVDDVWDDMRPLVRFFESPDKTKYYKLAFSDWCAPGPCSIFWNIEIF